MESAEGHEIVKAPNPNYGKERTQLVPQTSVDLRRSAAAQVGLKDFSVIKGAGGIIVRNGEKIILPKNMAMIRDGWEGITDPKLIDAYKKRVKELQDQERVKQNRK